MTRLDWDERVAYVDTTTAPGKSVWLGSGPPLGVVLCRAVRDALREGLEPGLLTKRGQAKQAELQEEFSWLPEHGTALVHEAPGRVRWWTFAGLKVNAALADGLVAGGTKGLSRDSFSIVVRAQGTFEISMAIEKFRASSPSAEPTSLVTEAIDGLKFSACVPEDLALAMLRRRLPDPAGFAVVLGEPILVRVDGDAGEVTILG